MIELLYKYPDMEKIEVRKDIIYKKSDNNLLKLDIYYSNNLKLAHGPTVVLVHGSSPMENIKDVELFKSWGKVLAASGFNTVMFNWRPKENPDDIKDLIIYLKNNSENLNINCNNLNIFAFSAGVEIGIKKVMEINTGFIKKIITYYGKLDSSIIKMIKLPHLPKFFIAMGALDDIFSINCNDDLIKSIRELGCEVEFVIHSKGEHGFDAFNKGKETNNIIEQTIRFIEN